MPIRDFGRLAHNVRVGKWTDETPVPPNVFGQMWNRDPPSWWTDETKNPDAAKAESGAF